MIYLRAWWCARFHKKRTRTTVQRGWEAHVARCSCGLHWFIDESRVRCAPLPEADVPQVVRILRTLQPTLGADAR